MKLVSIEPCNLTCWTASPRISDHALAGIALRDVRELTFERCGGRPAVAPFHFDRSRGERGVGSLRGAAGSANITDATVGTRR